MSATVLNVKKVTSKFNNSPAFRLDLLTEKGIKSKTVNKGSGDYYLLIQKYGDVEGLKGLKVEVDLVNSEFKEGWVNVYFKR